MIDKLPKLAEIKIEPGVFPVIIIDSREQTPLPFIKFKTRISGLYSGDYSFVGAEEIFSIERKSISDLVACCIGSNRERFMRELHRLRGYTFKRLLIVGKRSDIEKGKYRSKIKPQSVLNTLAAIEARFDLSVVFCDTPKAAASQVEQWAFWYFRELHGRVYDAAGTLEELARRKSLTSDDSDDK